jgi:guanylate kinase
MRGSVLIISGPSGVGKTKISRAIAKSLGAFLSVSVTTRPISYTEVNELDYQFIDQAQFDGLRQEGRFLEMAEVFGYSYGTLRQPVERALVDGKLAILEIDVEGAIEVKGQMPDCHAIFVLPPSEAALSDRLRRRGRDNEGDIKRRLSEARREIARAESSGIYDFFVVNEDLQETIAESVTWVRTQLSRY